MNEALNLTQSAPAGTFGYLAMLLHNISLKLGELLTQVKTEDSLWPLALLLAFSFAYGLIHAAGPGHGKTLVASYFSANDKSYKKAFTMSLAIALTHAFSALIITVIGYFILSDLLSITLYGSGSIIAKISGALIMSIGVYLGYDKFKRYRRSKNIKWSQSAPHSNCSCAACDSKDASELALVLSAGMIPCPGTITIFLLSLSLGTYFAAFLSALAMSFGMGTVIALSAALSVKFRRGAKNRFSEYLTALDFIAVAIVIILGLTLLISG